MLILFSLSAFEYYFLSAFEYYFLSAFEYYFSLSCFRILFFSVRYHLTDAVS